MRLLEKLLHPAINRVKRREAGACSVTGTNFKSLEKGREALAQVEALAWDFTVYKDEFHIGHECMRHSFPF